MITNATKIKIELLKAGISGARIARDLNITRAAVYHVIEGRNKSMRVKKAIAKAIGVRVEELWPGDGHKKAA